MKLKDFIENTVQVINCIPTEEFSVYAKLDLYRRATLGMLVLACNEQNGNYSTSLVHYINRFEGLDLGAFRETLLIMDSVKTIPDLPKNNSGLGITLQEFHGIESRARSLITALLPYANRAVERTAETRRLSLREKANLIDEYGNYKPYKIPDTAISLRGENKKYTTTELAKAIEENKKEVSAIKDTISTNSRTVETLQSSVESFVREIKENNNYMKELKETTETLNNDIKELKETKVAPVSVDGLNDMIEKAIENKIIDKSNVVETKQSYEKPVYEETVYEEPVHEEPVYEKSVYEEPIHEEPEIIEEKSVEPINPVNLDHVARNDEDIEIEREHDSNESLSSKILGNVSDISNSNDDENDDNCLVINVSEKIAGDDSIIDLDSIPDWCD